MSIFKRKQPKFSGGMLTASEIDKQIRLGHIKIDPYSPKQLNPNSYNLRLADELKIYKRNSPIDRLNVVDLEAYMQRAYDNSDEAMYIKEKSIRTSPLYNDPSLTSIAGVRLDNLDAKKDNEVITFTIPEEGIELYPGILYLGRTIEETYTDRFIPMINGRSSIGRLGISVHVTAGFGDIGFNGTWTLEITVVEPIRIYKGMELCQLCWFTPVGEIELYKGRYLNQVDPTPSRLYQSYEGDNNK